MKLILSLLLITFSSGLLFAQTEEVIVHIDKNNRSSDSSPLFVIVEDMPVFNYKNCSSTNECFLRYVADSIKSPSKDCLGKVYIQFVVEPDSTIKDVKILRGLNNCKGYREEIERILYSMPKWMPGKQKGNSVRVLLTMPIDFHPNE
jgi:protein TonB